MTPDEEKRVLKGLYDTIFSAITYSPGSDKPAPFDPSRTLIQLSKMEAINPADFANQLSPVNPNGDMNTAYNFFALTDTAPALVQNFTPSTRKVSETFRSIVNNANTKAKVDPKQKATWDANFNYLNQTTSIPNPPPDPPTQQVGPTTIAYNYGINQTNYVTAVGGYRTAMLAYDLTKVADQRAWNAVEPGLSLNLTNTWNAWTNGGKANVERAQNALQATINDIISSVIADAQKVVRPENWIKSGKNDFLLTYPLPSDWAKSGGAKGATQFTYKSSVTNTSSDTTATSYGGGAGFNAGLWSVGGGYNHSESAQNTHFDGTYVEIHATMTLVRIMRPWLNSLLFSVQGWSLKGQKINSISNGKLAGNSNSMLPLVPTAFVVMSNVTIKSDFSARDLSIIKSATSGSASVGWGPFSVSASYSHSESHEKTKATYSGGVLSVPGMQIVAWVNEILPPSPSMAG